MMERFVFFRPFHFFSKTIIIILWVCEAVFAQQINIPRVEMMPNQPAPYDMRDWRQVALGYDSLVFDLNASGQYLPLIWINSNPINYPNHESFGLDSYVGTYATNSGEAINVLAAVVGASLIGIDKSNQNGMNWALMCEEFFNRRPAENVYLNNPVTSSGSDWWYDAMPNIFFYQLYDMYPGTGGFAYQFPTLADRWLEAVQTMGGSAAPWHKPYMNYRGWYLESMTPNSSGVPEPEASGALGWLLYHAYKETGAEQYRLGAEWSMEFLSEWPVNPSYELQLPYGAYIAAKMNAELGTLYDVEKIVNWCFDVGSLRLWGVIIGNWGGYDVYGLIGEASGVGHYAFAMNGFEQVGALVPMARYDDRFARAIAKWTLNVANASRLYYSPFLPPEKQDNEAWTQQYDPNGYIAYEALRREWSGQSPYATGDAMGGGWAATNLGLYGSSHVGIFGGIIDTTNVPMILQLDALKTDYFRDEAYPTYLYFNPYSENKIVEIDVGSGQHDIYDAVSNSFLLSGVNGVTSFTIPADGTLLAVITPAGGTVTYDLDKMLIDGVVVDYNSGQPVANRPPRIKALAADAQIVFINGNSTIYCAAEDREGDPLTYNWNASGGMINGSSATVTWTAPDTAGLYTILSVVDDGQGGLDSAEIVLEVTDNLVPVITAITANPAIIEPGESTQLSCAANDPNGDTLSYTWTAPAGSISGSGATVTWTAPSDPGYYYVGCQVDDGHGGTAEDSIAVTAGTLVGYYPFSGNANDVSGFGNHGTVSGAAPVEDRFGNPNSAYYFDGVDDYVRVPNQPSLNFREAITVNLWMKVGEFFSREAYPISHGNWENRWKISITNKRVRWTVKTDTSANNGIKDLDSQSELVLDSLYMVTALFDGLNFEIYLNGVLNGNTTWGGRILATTIDLAIGQHLPGQNGFNFKGVLDDIRIFNRALTQTEIQDLYNETTGIKDLQSSLVPGQYGLWQNYPNPFNPVTTIRFVIPKTQHVTLKIYDVIGREVAALVDEKLTAGSFAVEWNARNNASGVYYYRLQAEDFKQTRKMILLR
jgi:hypothetical protein